MELPDSGATAKPDHRLGVSVWLANEKDRQLVTFARTGVAETTTVGALVAALRYFRRNERPKLHRPSNHCCSKDHIQHVHVPWRSVPDDRWLEWA